MVNTSLLFDKRHSATEGNGSKLFVSDGRW